MKSILRSTLSTTAALCLLGGLPSVVSAQNKAVSSVNMINPIYHNWYNLDPLQDKKYGVSVDRAYKELLNSKRPKKKIVVAVIDSGTDIFHPDLQGRIWVNTKEIPGNNIDDDNNGYVDDIHGWGFLGNSKGEDIKYETYEYVRILRKLKPKYEQVSAVDGLSPEDREQYQTFLLCKEKYDREVARQQQEKASLDAFAKRMQEAVQTIAQHLGKSSYTLEEVKNINYAPEKVTKAKNWLLQRYSQGYKPEMLKEFQERNDIYLKQHLNLEYNPRTIIADNPEDINERKYGNNNVIGPRADHGTPVAGIIAGVRGNNVGIEGIAENVEIMVLRAVPRGDEYDKDIALAIRYAVDNGAHIINMSFGKDFSPQKSFVDEAVKYAEQHNVLLIHGAGNDGRNLDSSPNFPTKQLSDGATAENWLEVGATSMRSDKQFCAEFSNYGLRSVDLFAPGVDILSLAPDNKYDVLDGTSFSCPVVSGVAALVWSYYPELTALELKEVLMQSATKYSKLKVYAPNLESAKKKKVKFSTLSKTGGVVNAYEALKLAEKTVIQKETKI